jgi:hypothetical protein
MLSCGFPFFPKDLDFSYCSQFGGEELEKLVPISNTLKRLALKGSKVGNDSLANYLQQVNSLYGRSRLESIDLSAINKAGSVLIGDVALRSISVRSVLFVIVNVLFVFMHGC